jgi:signal transduction histidine kinase
MTVTPLGQYMQDGVVIVHNNITERRQAEEALTVHRAELEKWESIQRLRELVVQNEKAREEERKYVAQELHDELGQVLTAVRMALLLMELRFCPDDAALAKVVADMKGLLDRAIQGTRDVVLHLRPTALDGGLVSALKWLSQDFFKRTGIACGLHIDDAHITVDETRSIVIFRIVQESLTNITRYAEASAVHIEVSQCGGALVIEISDDGKGFDVAAVGTRNTFGLLGMRERAKALGGRIDIVSTPLDGTTVRVSIPMNFENARKTP